MAKDKAIGKGVPNRHLHARATFLYQAAAYLTLQAGDDGLGLETTEHPTQKESCKQLSATRGNSGLALQLGAHLRSVSLKGQVRLSPHLKRSLCKTCNAVLVPGQNSTQVLQNKSKGERKPWADVLLIQCKLCGSQKRYPIGATRQQRKTKRALSTRDQSAGIHFVDIEPLHSATLPIETDHDPGSG
ncbi:Rpr2-domain-containing protein [Lindgomyces ingoldianus]|uniref:Rpr2-domain-containing protein n=1 Tax=Lindgomyces ingoldianus TaxID=673940 RepID=A0ACB6QHI9_9PLEO|nr:Rpr2-domain-containing protein [Lindgomyces ingoldianus]KAF2465970.1 Rpr2-domain-containing protein [Lindgomyces ingoldianus]